MSDIRPSPLVPQDVDLRDFQYLLIDVRALRRSRLAALSADEWMAGFTLMLESWHQVPASSVPNDDRLLARLSGAGRRWRRVKESALSEFMLCADGRYYHPLVAERALRCWAAKQALRRREIRRLEILSDEWAALRAEAFARDRYTCRYCRSTGVRLEADHIVPVSRGGSSELSNLATACKPCNRSKGAKTLAEWKH